MYGMISTGLGEIDAALGGGLKAGIVDIYGGPATGKTQFVLHMTKREIASGGRVLFQDTTGKFRPERLHEMLLADGMSGNLLELVDVSRATNSKEQRRVLDRLGRHSLLVIDDITELFSFDYPQKLQLRKRNIIFVRYLMKLCKLSLENEMPVLAVNSVRSIDSVEKETMWRAMDMFTHVKLRLAVEGARDVRRYCTVRLPRTSLRIQYEISAAGIKEV